ncbi:MAG: tetratricopeptide repeat protein [Bacteroidetes bacterium]|nr:tetratricopeptide repeat protein [Bacteroidota bacterium]
MVKLRGIVLILAVWGGAGLLFAQKTTAFIHEDANYKTAVQLYENQKYGAAQKYFYKTITSYKDPNSLVRIDAEYYAAICAIELFNKDAELLLKQFIALHPESPHKRKAYFNLGKYNYRKKKFKTAIEYFWAVDVYDLTGEEKAELYFKRGYSYFELSENDEVEKLDPIMIHTGDAPRKYVASNIENAKADFYQIKDIDTKYTHPANYYYSHISYSQQNYETALQGFLKLTQNADFGPIVPYYITQIYYLQGKYEDAIKFATPLLSDTSNTKRQPEIARIIGEANFRTGKFAESIPFLKQYEKMAGAINRQDKYQLGFAYYKTNDCDNAISYFQEMVDEKDSLTQNAYYHLADCYIRKNNKQGARTAFGFASKLNFDPGIKENALFSYAKLSYELAFNPFGESIRAFQEYIRLYPNSPRIDECYTYLVNVFMTTRNYKEALRSIENIKALKEEMKPAYQKIAYYRAIDFFNNAEMDSAINYFEKAFKYPVEKSINALVYYWKGEAFYRKKDYEKAIDNYKEFILKPGAFSMPEYGNANYSIGYAYFQMKDYTNANLSFRKFVTSTNNATDKLSAKKITDAYVRIGDTYFINKDYSGAADSYGSAISMKAMNADYSLYQQALAFGLLKMNKKKIDNLLKIANNYPKSTYTAATKFELGKTYFQENEYDQSLVYYQKVIDEHPSCSYVNRSLNQVGLIYYNKKQDDKALQVFDKLIRKDRKSEEAEEALPIVKKIYVAKNDIDGLEKYFREVSATIPSSSLDSAAYNIAHNAYMEGDCKQASLNFNKYIVRFVDGIFILDAYFYKAECDYRSGNPDLALGGYNYIIDKNKNVYTEQSLVNAAAINYKQQNYQNALGQYIKLEEVAEYPRNIMDARIGEMRCNYYLKNYDAAITGSNKVITTDKVPAEVINEAHLIIARSAMELKNNELAYSEFQAVANLARGELKAEAKYNIAYLQYARGEYKESKATVFDLVKNESAYPLWMTRALILLSDNYVALKDNFQAKHTLKTVIESSDFPDLVKVAQDKLNAITEAEKAVQTTKITEEPKIEFKENSTEKNKQLFTDPQQQKDQQPK